MSSVEKIEIQILQWKEIKTKPWPLKCSTIGYRYWFFVPYFLGKLF